jgi:LuxR family transcriptional regulator, quorum-sensing system regulator CciR
MDSLFPRTSPARQTGLASLRMANGQELEGEQLLLVQLVGAFAFESARRLTRPTLRSDNEAPRLTERQLECVVLVARGKTDWEISRIP